jgi:5-keto 4-deoxyuronate isomerase
MEHDVHGDEKKEEADPITMFLQRKKLIILNIGWGDGKLFVDSRFSRGGLET